MNTTAGCMGVCVCVFDDGDSTATHAAPSDEHFLMEIFVVGFIIPFFRFTSWAHSLT